MRKIFRVDSRIVHGQTVNYWCNKYEISKIIVANDELAKDSLKKLFFKIAISKEIDLEFVEIKAAVSMEYSDSNNYMIIFKNIEDVVKYVENQGRINELIVSNLGYGEGRSQVCEGVFLSEDELKQVSLLENKFGVSIRYKIIPD